MKELNPEAVDIFYEKDIRFMGLHGMRDTISRQLCEAGVSATVKHTSVLSEAEEEKLWSSDVLGTGSPKALLNVVFFVVTLARMGRGYSTLFACVCLCVI